MKLDEEALAKLKKSIEIVGQLYGVVRCKQHPDRILMGRHRLAVLGDKARLFDLDVDAKAKELGYSHDLMERLIIYHSNIQRQVSKEERREELIEMAKQLEKEGLQKEKIARRIAELVSLDLTERYVYELLPDEYKEKVKMEAGKKGGEKSAELSSAKPTVSLEKVEEESVPQATAPVITEGRTAEETITQYPPEERVYPIASAPRATEHRKPTDTEAEQLLTAELSRRGVEFLTQVPYVRESEFTADGIPKTYTVDILIGGNMAIEVEGEGSSSANNKERDDFFRSKGIRVFHIPNSMIMKYADVVADLIAYIWVISKEMRK
jgi:very-short-patch-repair endonuclease